MADERQLEILRQGVGVWNKWRKDNPGVEIDLERANLDGAFLAKANLSRASLDHISLKGASFFRADLSETYISDAYLMGADLSEAKLAHTYFVGTDLTGANLSKASLADASLTLAIFKRASLLEAYLGGAKLLETNLEEADLTDSEVELTTFGNTDLSAAIGLETVRHLGPSTLGTDTIQISKGKIPIEFLRGCGLSDLDIEYAKLADPDLSGKEIIDIIYKIGELCTGGFSVRYNSLFISYSTKDQDFAQRLHDDLQNSGVRCWFAPHDIKGGEKIHEQIDRAIQTHDRLLLVLSENSMNSEWVKTEITNARQKEINEKRQVLFPISIVDFQKIREWKNFDADTGKDTAREIREYFIPDFSRWKDNAAYRSTFERLLRDLIAQ